jgi:hypothetical protein
MGVHRQESSHLSLSPPGSLAGALSSMAGKITTIRYTDLIPIADRDKKTSILL